MRARGRARARRPRPGDVRLRVHAAALNFPDVLMCRGEYQVKPPLPFTPGAEVAGVVDEVGDVVEGVQVGDRVLAIPNFGPGGFAEYDDRGRGRGRLPDPGVDVVRLGVGAARRVPDRSPRVAPPRAPPGRGDAARARGRGRGRERGDPTRSRSGRARDRDRGRRGEGRGVPRARRASRARLPGARFRRRGEGVHGRSRRGCHLRPGRRRHVRPVDEVHRVRGPDPHHRIHRRPLRRTRARTTC